MGEPQGSGAVLFGAWGMGHFGPCTFPGALERAVQHAYRFRDAIRLVPRHRAFVRIRSSYVFGASDDAPIAPEDYDALDELRFVTSIQRVLAGLAGCLAVFNPNGELVLSAEQLDATLARDAAGSGLAVDAWANVRLFGHEDDTGAWTLFDTVGMEQLDVADHEAVLPTEHASFEHVPGLLYTMAAYDAERRGVLSRGDTATDTGGVAWTATGRDEAIVTPPRQALRWMPRGIVAPDALRARAH